MSSEYRNKKYKLQEYIGKNWYVKRVFSGKTSLSRVVKVLFYDINNFCFLPLKIPINLLIALRAVSKLNNNEFANYIVLLSKDTQKDLQESIPEDLAPFEVIHNVKISLLNQSNRLILASKSY